MVRAATLNSVSTLLSLTLGLVLTDTKHLNTFDARMRIFPNPTQHSSFILKNSFQIGVIKNPFNRDRSLDQSRLESGDSAAQWRHTDAGFALQELGQERAAHLERGPRDVAGFLAGRLRGAVGGDS